MTTGPAPTDVSGVGWQKIDGQEFRPGDVIIDRVGTVQVRNGKPVTRKGYERRWIVLDPPYTTQGKLRVQSERGAELTVWGVSGEAKIERAQQQP